MPRKPPPPVAICECAHHWGVPAEQAFLGWLVPPGNRTLAENLAPQIEAGCRSGAMPALMAGGSGA